MPLLAYDVYTNQPSEGPYIIFPTHGHQILSNCCFIFGVSILSFCFARRTENDRFTSWLWWCNLTWARLLIILIFLDSWLFLAFSGILVNGVGLSYSVPVCSLGIFACIFFYAGSKALTYLFLVERVWIVCSAGKSITRMQSRVYKVCVVVLLGYAAIVIDMILGRYARIRDDGVCVIGLHSFATIPLLSYDLFINIFLTSMFLWFLCREEQLNERLRRLARRTAVATVIALTTSCVNILILAILKGKQLGWVCLSSCAADVCINALVLFWVTSGSSRDPFWHGAWEVKDGAVYAEPHDLPPLNFPVSFVADPEMGLTQTKSMETIPVMQQTRYPVRHQSQMRQQRSINQCLGDAGEVARQKEFCEGSSKDGLFGHERYSACAADVNKDCGSDEDNNGKRSPILKDVEWDITDSVSSQRTHCDGSGDKGMGADKDNGRQSWYLTLDLEPQRPPLLSIEHSEPDSPATHTTGESRALLIPKNPTTQYSIQSVPPQARQKEPKKQRRRWSTRSRRRRLRLGSQHRSASSLPSAPQQLEPVVASYPESLPRPSASSVPLSSPRRSIFRSQSDSFVRVSEPPLFAGRPRLSQ